VTELQDAEAPYGIWETVLGVCVERGAYSEVRCVFIEALKSELERLSSEKRC
jgi:hypothetical protein